MESFIKWLETQALTVIGLLIGIIGIITGYIFYRKSLRVPEPCWSCKTDVLIKGYKATNLPKLSITYERQNVEIISSTKLLFWNMGKLGIRRGDILADSSLLANVPEEVFVAQPELRNSLQIICAPNVELLDVMQLPLDDEANPLDVERVDNKMALLTFNYLGKNDGGVVQVLHTGISPNDINIVGTIMDADLRYVDMDSITSYFNELSSLIPWSILSFIFVLIAALVGLTGQPEIMPRDEQVRAAILIILMTMANISGLFTRIFIYIRKPAGTLPPKLRTFIRE